MRRDRVVTALVAAVLLAAVVIGGVLTMGPTTVDPTVTGPAPTTTAPAAPGDVYQVATATVASLEVLTEPPEGLTRSPLFVPREVPTQPIPRNGLNTAGVTATADGFTYDNPTYFGNPLRLLVVSEHPEWLEVAVQARPNQLTGWVRRSDVELSSHDARMELDLASRRLVARVDGEVVVDTVTTIGTPDNPTPTGIYFITEVIAQDDPTGDFGPFILATSGYSEQLEFFEDGMPIIAVHGTNEPDLMGEQATNGCVRLTNDLITRLAEVMPPGVPLVVTGAA